VLAQDMGVNPQRHRGVGVAEASRYDMDRDVGEQQSRGVVAAI
jgi:hypothetical protein